MKENKVGETINDFLNYAKQKNIQIFAVPYMDLLNQIGKKTQLRKSKYSPKNDKCLNNRSIFCVTKI
jgi:hypothetical protein